MNRINSTTQKRKRCCNCNLMTTAWQRINGSPWHCYDGCYSTTGIDNRTVNGKPMWEGNEVKTRDYA